MKEVEVFRKKIGNWEQWLKIHKGSNLQAVYSHEKCPALIRRTLEGWIAWQKRNASTVEQALRAVRLAPQFTAALLALGTKFESTGSEEILDLATAIQRKSEVFGTEWYLLVPISVPARKTSYEAAARTGADEPIVAAAAVLDYERRNVVYAGLAVTGMQQGGAVSLDAEFLKGLEPDAGTIREYLKTIHPDGDLQDTFKGSSTYRQNVGEVVVQRVLEACLLGEDEK